MTASAGAPTVKQFEILSAGAGSFILVVMTNAEIVKNKLIKLPIAVSEQDLKLLSAVLNASLTDLPAEGFTPELLARVTRSAGAASSLVPGGGGLCDPRVKGAPAQRGLCDRADEAPGAAGVPGCGKSPGGALHPGIPRPSPTFPPPWREAPRPRSWWGPENIAKELKDTSVVMTRFDIGEGMQGLIGVVGPTRMDYAQITARLSYFAENLGRMFGKPELPPSHQEGTGDD